MQGKIVKGIAGFYYVHVAGSGVYECRAKGIFRKDKMKPLVGDDVEMEILDEAEKEGNITALLPRHNKLVRPAVANIDQALVVFAAVKPSPHFNLLDRFLVMMGRKDIPAILCFNKEDIAPEEKLAQLKEIYRACGCPLLFVSAKEGRNIEALEDLLEGKTTVIAGHTTRHSELFLLDEGSYIMDTPGFSSLYVNDFEKEELKMYFSEFAPYEGECRFKGCDHMHEPGCAVKEAVEEGKIHDVRYRSYRIYSCAVYFDGRF